MIPADTLFNLGKAEGSIDGGQMIKPALARGLQLVGATTRMFYVTLLLRPY
jgi:ATP-dependent Clp protease ATP-binding subunit ClpB